MSLLLTTGKLTMSQQAVEMKVFLNCYCFPKKKI